MVTSPAIGRFKLSCSRLTTFHFVKKKHIKIFPKFKNMLINLIKGVFSPKSDRRVLPRKPAKNCYVFRQEVAKTNEKAELAKIDLDKACLKPLSQPFV